MDQELYDAVDESVIATIEDWNKKRLKNFSKVFVLPYPEFFQGFRTQERTKIISPILTQIFYREMNSRLPDFIKNETDGRNFENNGVPYELNITLATGNSWTGNGYDKVPYHILLRFSIDESGEIYEKFAMFVDLDKCRSRWTLPEKESNFSTLKFLRRDSNRISLINGNIKVNPTYLKPIMAKV